MGECESVNDRCVNINKVPQEICLGQFLSHALEALCLYLHIDHSHSRTLPHHSLHSNSYSKIRPPVPRLAGRDGATGLWRRKLERVARQRPRASAARTSRRSSSSSPAPPPCPC